MGTPCDRIKARSSGAISRPDCRGHQVSVHCLGPHVATRDLGCRPVVHQLAGLVGANLLATPANWERRNQLSPTVHAPELLQTHGTLHPRGPSGSRSCLPGGFLAAIIRQSAQLDQTRPQRSTQRCASPSHMVNGKLATFQYMELGGTDTS